MFDPHKIKSNFPLLSNNPDLHYLDSAATSLKPQPVIDAISDYYQSYSGTVKRGIYDLTEQATAAFEDTRKKAANFINANSSDEIVFTSGTTQSLNLLACGLGAELTKGDRIATTIMEHHSNFLPWQQLAKQKEVELDIIGIHDSGTLKLEELDTKITPQTKILAIVHISNVLGTINPIQEIITKAKEINPEIIVVVDACQSAPHAPLNVQELGCDALAFSGHKMLGPTGVGVLWAKKELLEKTAPCNFGGEMIEAVYIDHSEYQEPPHKFEAGTPNIAGVIGLGAAIDYIESLGRENIRAYEIELTEYALQKLESRGSINLIGPTEPSIRAGAITFAFKQYHPHDVAQILNENNVAVRAGQHCAMPLHARLGIDATTRASFCVYTTKEDIDALIDALQKVEEILQ